MRLITILLICLPILSYAGGENDPPGARSAAMANTGLTFTDIWSIYHNQAGLGYIQGPTASVFYENKFLINNFAYAGFAGAIPLGNGAIGVSYTNFGYSAYNEGKVGLAYGMKLSEKFAVGVQLNYHTIRIDADGYGSKGALSADVGFRLQVSKNVSLAAHISNPTRTSLNDYDDERIPTVIRFGAGYQISDDLLATGEVEKDIDMNPVFRAGVEYQPADILFLRIGASSNPGLLAFGFGLNFDAFKVDLSTTYHSTLGYSPQIALTYAPGKK